MSRLVAAGAIVRSQLDFYSPPNSITRVNGVTIASLGAAIFVNNSQLNWPLADGAAVMDSNVSAGYVYFNEIASSPSYYSVRFFPDRVGFWRLIFTNLSYSIQPILEFDVVPSGTFQQGVISSGLNAAFVRSS
jgi:hypothetical protein